MPSWLVRQREKQVQGKRGSDFERPPKEKPADPAGERGVDTVTGEEGSLATKKGNRGRREGGKEKPAKSREPTVFLRWGEIGETRKKS